MFEEEERQIAKKIKEFIQKEEPIADFYIMLRNGRILNTEDYLAMVNYGKINPQDAYVYIKIIWEEYKADFYYPFLQFYGSLVYGYLSKQGFYNWPFVAPATGLKYIANAEGYGELLILRYVRYLSIELLNLDTVVNNTNLRKIVAEVLGEKLISGEKELTNDEVDEIFKAFDSQLLFAGHTPNKAWSMIYYYYDKGDESLTKEVARIAMDYERIFQPYRVCYDMNSWEEIDCSSIRWTWI